MQAVKVFNNNAVSVVMPDGREAILVGNGLGFGRRPGDVIDKTVFPRCTMCRMNCRPSSSRCWITLPRR